MNNGLVILFEHEVQDIYSAENQVKQALPGMIKKAKSKKLKKTLNDHLEETRAQIERLEKIQDELKLAAEEKICKGMRGLLEEGEEILKQEKLDGALDAAIIAAAKKVEQYEITSYSLAISHAEAIEYEGILHYLKQSLSEEFQADRKLAEIAQQESNIKALESFITK
jgi:ferritin-like metal-binding protein YciE